MSATPPPQADHESAVRDGRDPTLPPNHPINAFSKWKKLGILITLSFSGFLANYSAAAFQVAFVPMAKYFGVPVPKIPQTIGYNLLGLAVGPLFWNPLSKTIGRRPTYLLGSILFIPCVIWMALSKTYISFCLARVFAGLTSSFSQTVPPSTIADIFVKNIRGHKMSMFGVAVIIAPVVAPFICGLVINSRPWQDLFWIVLGLAGLQLAMFFLLVPETLWIEDTAPASHEHAATEMQPVPADHDVKSKSFEDRHIEEGTSVPALHAGLPTGHCGPAWMPWQRPGEYFRIFMSPILMLHYFTISIPSIYYGSIFAWSVGITIVLPQKFEEPPYSFSSIALGSSFLAFGLGGILGKWSGGIVGDKVVSYLERRRGHRQPEYRLYALFPIFPFMFVGLLMVGLTVDKQLHWMVLLVGGGLYFYCLSAATGVLQTYVLEGFISRSMDTQAVFVFWKAIWGFAIAFFVYEWGMESSFLTEYAIQGALAAGVGGLLCALLIWKGHEIRRWQGMPIAK